MAMIRQVVPSDLDEIYAISLATGDGGKDAAPLYRDSRMVGHIYSAPYATLSPNTVFVVEDADGIAGYIAGAHDTRHFEECLENDWWPVLRAIYADPAGDPETWDADQRRSFTIHHPRRMWDAILEAYPAHIHMNLLPRLQGHGLGTRLLDRWIANARNAGVKGIHLGINASNQPGQRFWMSRGFEPLPQSLVPDTEVSIWLGKAL